MGRIREVERVGVLDAFVGHWTEANTIGGAIEIAPGYGLPELIAQRAEYHAKGEEILDLETQVGVLRAERDAAFGTSSAIDQGVWFRLRQYRTMVRLRLGALHPLTQTVPKIGNVQLGRYLTIVDHFIDHWERVDAELVPPLTLGAFALADLKTARDTINARMLAVDEVDQVALPLARAERERLFGDLPQEVRDDESIVSRLQLYAITILTQFPAQPIAVSLPEIFPVRIRKKSLPKFRFNWVALTGARLRTWFQLPDLADASVVYLKEGSFEATQPIDMDAADPVQVHTWTVESISGELDELEIRSASGTTLALGLHDASFTEPASEELVGEELATVS